MPNGAERRTPTCLPRAPIARYIPPRGRGVAESQRNTYAPMKSLDSILIYKIRYKKLLSQSLSQAIHTKKLAAGEQKARTMDLLPILQ